MSSIRLITILATLCIVITRSSAADAPAIAVEVDVRDLPRRLVHTTLEIPCKPGPLRLWYPKWFPGSHGPHGRVEDIAGLRVETPDGKSLSWTRDEVELHSFHVKVPEGADKIRVKLDTVCESAGADKAGTLTVGTPDLGVVNWNTCLVYPDGPAADDQPMDVRLRLPEGWKHASALKLDKEKDGVIAFRTVSLTTLVDSPLIAGKLLKTYKLDAGAGPPAFLHVTSESSEAVKLDPKLVELYSRVTREAWALFGVAHYSEYHFLIVCSDALGQFGLEHLSCSLNGMGERGLIDEKLRKGWWLANLVPHEYAHSWCGKYRRPTAMITPNFHSPQKTKLLWVYEGLTEYLGEVLSVRAGLRTPEEYKLTLTNQIRGLSRTSGRQWRPLEDTAVAAHLSRNPGSSWNQLRRLQDFYMEGALLWYECDAIIREKTDGKKSLDDFCQRFFAASGDKKSVAGYELADVVRDLKATAEYDWDTFLKRWVATPQESLPLDVVERLGYRLKYTDKAPGAGHLGVAPENPAADSLGAAFAQGLVTSVDPGLPADKAGLSPGMKVLGVNGKKFSTNRLRDAIADSVSRKKVELLIEDGDDFRTIVVTYAEGLRYLELEQVKSKTDVLGDILKPRAK